MLVDTDVLIWYLRGNNQARLQIETLPGFFISVVTYIELVQGMRNKQELRYLRLALKSWNAEVLLLSEEISAKAMFYVEQHYLSHSLQLADALVGTTAIAYGLDILTGNAKHYRVLKDVAIKEFKPA
jgi:predicted nucleic acid-binding protein